VSEYFTKLKGLWDELGACLQLPTCNCAKEYNFSKHQEAEKVHQFLMGLDSTQFGVVRSNILAIEPLPNLNKVYAMILREESQKNLSHGAEARIAVEGAAFKATVAGRNRLGNRPRCSHCSKLGHEKNQCFEIVGYPPNWPTRRANRVDMGQRHTNQGGGNPARIGPVGQNPAGVASFAGRQGEQRPAKPSSEGGTTSIGFTQDQIDALFAMF